MFYPKICIVVLNWNGIKDTIECIDSISTLEYKNYEVVVVDNGSTDSSVEIIRRKYPRITIIESENNLGYTGGNNLGIKYALETMADYVWILNNDTILEADSLRKMVSAGERDRKIGILSPFIFYNKQRNKMQFCGAFFDLKNGIMTAESHEENANIKDTNDRVLVLFGTAMLIRRSVIEKIGVLDDRFFAYFEDYDYSLRAKKNNFQAVVVKSAKIYHKDASSSGGNNSPTRIYYYHRNLMFLWKKHLKGSACLLANYKHIRKSIGASILYKITSNRLLADAILDGIWDGLIGKGGPRNLQNGMPLILKKGLFFIYHYGKYGKRSKQILS